MKDDRVKRLSILMFTIVLTILFSSSAFAAINVALSDQGTGVRNRTSNMLLESGDLIVEVWDAPTGGNKIYEETFTGAIVNGSWNVMLGENPSIPLPLEFGKQYYRDYQINGEDATFTNLTGGSVDRQFFFAPLGDIGAEDLEANINLSNAIGYGWNNLADVPAGFADGVDDTGSSERWDITGSDYLFNDSGVLDVNETKLNATIAALDTDTDTDTQKAAGGAYLYNDSSSIYLNETKLNATIDAKTAGLDTDTDTHTAGDGTYLYNDSNTMYLNETRLNNTITGSVNGSSMDAGNFFGYLWDNIVDKLFSAVDSIYIYVNGGTLTFNETKLNATIDARTAGLDTDTDTHAAGDGVYLYNDSSTIYLNETKLNATITALDTDTDTDTQKTTAGPYVYNDSTTIYFNETKLNATITALDTDTQKAAGGTYLYNDTTAIYLNETALNATIEALDTNTDTDTLNNLSCGDTQIAKWNNTASAWQCADDIDTDTDTNTLYYAGGLYIYNNGSNYFTLNETKLNATIDERDSDTTYTNGTGLELSGTTFSLLTSCSDGQVLKWNNTASNWYCADDTDTDTDTQKTAAGAYLYNDSTAIYLNETKLNATIEALDTDTDTDTDTHAAGDGVYLYNDSTTMYLNETLLNATIDTRATAKDTDTDTQKTTAGPYVYNDTTTIYFNESKLNATITALDTDTDTDTQKAAAGTYLYNDTTTIYLNESKLNATIQSLDTDTDTNTNCSTDGSCPDIIYESETSGLSVNQSTWWNSITDWINGWFYKSGNSLAFNETKLNATIEALDTDTDTDTQKTTAGPYVYNDSTTIYFNESKLNATIDARDTDTDTDTHAEGDGVYLYNDSSTIYLNETKLNATITALDTDTDTDTQKAAAGAYLYNDTTTIYFNETKLNATITALDTDTDTNTNCSADGSCPDIIYESETAGLSVNQSTWWNSITDWINGWFYKNGNSLAFNETKLNATIDARTAGLDTNTNCSADGSCPDIIYESETAGLSVNQSTWWNSVTGWVSRWFYKNGVELDFNETLLNATIDARAAALDTDTQKAAGGTYLYNDSTAIYLNESKLNETITLIDEDTIADLSCSDTQVAKWNNTASAWQCADDTDTDTDTNTLYYAGGLYIYNNGSNYFTLNETKLNATITALDTDTDTNTNCSSEGSCSAVTYDTEAAGAYVNTTGDTMTGDLNISGADMYVSDDKYIYLGNDSDASIHWDSSNNRLVIKVN